MCRHERQTTHLLKWNYIIYTFYSLFSTTLNGKKLNENLYNFSMHQPCPEKNVCLNLDKFYLDIHKMRC